jgi:transcriptional regulator GlxA family with amidase domain
MPSGLSLSSDAGFDEQVYDMLYLPALWRNPRPIIHKSKALIDWLRYQYENGAIINSTGTGVCFVAEAGLLDERPATTHWYYFEQFTHDYPNVQLKRQHFITQAGKFFCAASVNALTDLTLHHVRRFFSADVSEHVSRHFSHEVRQSFDRLSFSAEKNHNHPDEVVLQAQLRMQNNLSHSSISLKKLATVVGMSQRNLTRRFKAATDMTPVQYLQRRRLDEAKELLKTTNLSIKEIAYRVGYIDVSYFSKIFKGFFTITPREFRKTVRAKLFNTP